MTTKIKMLKTSWANGKALLIDEVVDVHERWAAYLIENSKAEAFTALKSKKKF